jgi:hypothetical protein
LADLCAHSVVIAYVARAGVMVNKKRRSTMSVRVIREPFPIVSVEKSSFKETYGGAEDIVMVFAL